MNYLAEQLKTARNLIAIAFILIENERKELLPTVLEVLLLECQNIVDEHCVEKE